MNKKPSLDEVLAEREAEIIVDPMIARALRKRAGLTQDQIARVLGVTRSAVSRYESGLRQPSGALRADYAEILRRLAQVGALPLPTRLTV